MFCLLIYEAVPKNQATENDFSVQHHCLKWFIETFWNNLLAQSEEIWRGFFCLHHDLFLSLSDLRTKGKILVEPH